MPTVLHCLGYSKPYVAFGKNLMQTKDEDTWAVNYNNGIYQYVKGNYILQFDGQATKAVYDIKNDWLMTRNLKDKVKEQTEMERELKAIIQSYMERMADDSLTAQSE
jgi:sulfur transfer complex TusBCD TusB component (DsrH family)